MKLTLTIESTDLTDLIHLKSALEKVTRDFVKSVKEEKDPNKSGCDCIQPVGNRDESKRRYFNYSVNVISE
jgi:hypothetical protein